jgi:predicted ATP-binding protein involved in virulence
MAAVNSSKLVRITVRNIGCIGNDGVEVELDNVVCLVGKNNAGKSTVLRAYELAKGSVAFDFAKDLDHLLFRKKTLSHDFLSAVGSHPLKFQTVRKVRSRSQSGSTSITSLLPDKAYLPWKQRAIRS